MRAIVVAGPVPAIWVVATPAGAGGAIGTALTWGCATVTEEGPAVARSGVGAGACAGETGVGSTGCCGFFTGLGGGAGTMGGGATSILGGSGTVATICTGTTSSTARRNSPVCSAHNARACSSKTLATTGILRFTVDLAVRQYVKRSGRISCRIVVAISSIDLVVVDNQRIPLRRIMASPCATSSRQFSRDA